jgi:hypothetical protein
VREHWPCARRARARAEQSSVANSPLRARQPRQGCDPEEGEQSFLVACVGTNAPVRTSMDGVARREDREKAMVGWAGTCEGEGDGRRARGVYVDELESVVRRAGFSLLPPSQPAPRARRPLSLSLLLLSHPRAAPPHPHPSPHTTPHLTSMAFALSSKAGLAASSTRSRVVSGRDDGGEGTVLSLKEAGTFWERRRRRSAADPRRGAWAGPRHLAHPFRRGGPGVGLCARPGAWGTRAHGRRGTKCAPAEQSIPPRPISRPDPLPRHKAP